MKKIIKIPSFFTKMLEKWVGVALPVKMTKSQNEYAIHNNNNA